MIRFLIVLLLALSSPALAENSFQVMPEYACKQDAVKFCKYTLDNASPFTILACLSAHRKQLSKDCRSVLERYK